MKAFYQAPVGYTLPPSQGPRHLFLSRSPYHHNSHQHHRVASNDIYTCNNKHKRQTLTLSGMSSEKFPETVWNIRRSSSSESLKNIKDAEQKVLIDGWEWDPTADCTSDMDAQFIESIIFDRTLYKYEILDRKARAANFMKEQVALVLLAIRNEGLVLPDTLKPEDYSSLDIILFPFVKELSICSCPVTDACFERTRIGYIGGTINFDIPKKLLQMVKMFASWKNLSFFIPNDEVITYDTFIEKFHSNRKSGGLLALEEFLHICSFRTIHRHNVEDAIFYLFSSFENVLEMLDLCIKFAEGISFNQEKVQSCISGEKAQSSPLGGFSDAISFVKLLKSKELSLRTSYALVGLCLRKHCQPGELTPQELQSIGFPCNSLKEIHWARSLLLGKQIIFDSSINQDSLSNLLFWCRELHIDPQVFC